MAILRDSESQLINIHKWTEQNHFKFYHSAGFQLDSWPQLLALGSGLVTLGLGVLELRQPKVRAKFRLRVLNRYACLRTMCVCMIVSYLCARCVDMYLGMLVCLMLVWCTLYYILLSMAY